MIDFGRPHIRGLLLETTIYYYPPPQEIARTASLFTYYLTPTIIAVTAVLFGLLYLGSQFPPQRTSDVRVSHSFLVTTYIKLLTI